MYKYRFKDYLKTIYTKMRITTVISSPSVNDMKKTWGKKHMKTDGRTMWDYLYQLCEWYITN